MSRPTALWDVEADSLARLAATENATVLIEIRCKRHNEWVGAVVDHHVPTTKFRDAPEAWGDWATLADIALVSVTDERRAGHLVAQRQAFPEVSYPRSDTTAVRAFHLNGSTAAAHRELILRCPRGHPLALRLEQVRAWTQQARHDPESRRRHLI